MGCRDNHCEPLPIFETGKKGRHYYLDLHKICTTISMSKLKTGWSVYVSGVLAWSRDILSGHARKSDVTRCPRHTFEDDLGTYDFTTQIVYSCM